MRALAAVGALAMAGAPGCGGKLDTPTPPPVAAEDGSTEAVRLAVRPVFWPGESAVLSLTFAKIEVARLEFAVGEPGRVNGRPAIRVRSLTTSDGILAVVVKLREEVLTTIDTATGAPLTSRGSFLGLFAGKPDDGVEERPWTYGDGLNTHAFIGMLRGWIAPVGARAFFDLVVSGHRKRVDLAVAGQETVRGHNGLYPAVRIEGTVHRAARGGGPLRFVAWVSDDASRLLLRIDAETDFGGVLSGRLVHYARSDLHR